MKSFTPRFHARDRRLDRRRVGMLLAFALLAGALSTFVAPAPGASALAIDCSYDSGLSVFIGSGRDGLTCMGGGTRTPGTVYGGGSLPGQTVAGGASFGSVCRHDTPALPDSFYAWGNITTSNASYDFTEDDGSRWHATSTVYFRNGRSIAVRTIETSTGRPLEMVFIDLTLIDFRTGAGVALQSTFNCFDDDTWVASAPQIHTRTTEPVSGTPTPPATASRTLDTKATMAPVPFHPGQYFLRVDVTDNHPAPSTTPVLLDLDLTAYSISSVVQLPRDGSCPAAYPDSELCISPRITPGETQTFTFVVSQRAGTEERSNMVIKTYHEGWHKAGTLNRPGLASSVTVATPAA